MLRKLNVANRISIGFGSLLLLLVLTGLEGLFGLHQVEREITRLLHGDLAFNTAIVETRHHLSNLRRFEKDLMLNFDAADKVAEYKQKWEESLAAAEKSLAEAKRIAPPEGDGELDRLAQAKAAYAQNFRALLRQVEAGQFQSPGQINTSFGSAKEPIRNMQEALGTLSEQALANVAAIDAKVENTNRKATYTAITLTLVAAILGGLLAIAIIRGIRRPLYDLQNHINEIQRTGKLSIQLPVYAEDEIGQTSRTMNHLLEGMNHVIGQANTNSQALLSAAQSLTDSSRQVTLATHQQSEASNATAAAIEELTVSVNMISDNARTLAEAAEHTAATAGEGTNHARRTAEAINQVAVSIASSTQVIGQLNQRSDEIGGIAMVIKGIADQTNLLALNAAIEAARAGELGRGFAVVADEVRKLAERTTQATVEITGKINAVQQDTARAASGMEEAGKLMERGVSQTEEVAGALAEIESRATETVDRINQMAHAIREQSVASNEIARNVERIAQAGEQNHAAAANANDLADELTRLASQLDQTISRYRH
ncbi:methyl-accepting chemotaxis protein [Chitiniphilus purpureus]|uniref:Methyl-accepting chemotaxis protein n=1 Tax=Chitiniphilus purpureus TaxID=2981137 RepID=A0ABY6DJ33_9NEIS|nr:methyl-accepting chemotaxis protein [Chitiniphilus sp. CD1]UXY14369.1 methyl-accepting chemotaxis protein [Chitiniphilus sp. CD1]